MALSNRRSIPHFVQQYVSSSKSGVLDCLLPLSVISTRLISTLRTAVFTADEWRRLPRVGKSIGPVGRPTSNLWEWTLIYRTPISTKERARCPASLLESDLATMVETNKSALEQSLALSRPLARQYPWPGDTIQRRSSTPTMGGGNRTLQQ